jgi:hypothetical protein
MNQYDVQWPSPSSYGVDCVQSTIMAGPTLWFGYNDNDLEATETILGVACMFSKRELRKLHTTFGGFGLFNLPTEQLICRINILLQYYHMSTALSRKLDAFLRYLQLQLGTLHNPLCEKWGHLATSSWVKMLWRSLDKFNIQLHMKNPTIPYPHERDQVIIEMILKSISSRMVLQRRNWYGVRLQCIFLSDMVTADS